MGRAKYTVSDPIGDRSYNVIGCGKQDFRWVFLFRHLLIRYHKVDQFVEQQEAEAKEQ